VAVRYHAVVIGGGHNGLTAAAYLARAGRKVLVLESRRVIGGAAVTEEIFPGFRYSVCSYVVSLLRPQIIHELELAKHGLKILPLDGVFSPTPDGDYLWRVDDPQLTHREIARWRALDADAYDAYSERMARMARFVRPLLDITPPDPASSRPRDLLQFASLIRRFRALPDNDRRTVAQLMSMSAADFLDQWFETDVLKATLAASGIIGTFLGVRSPGTAYVLLHHYMGELDGVFRAWGVPVGGTGAVSKAIADAARLAGAEVRTDAPVARIRTRNQCAVGVALVTGDEIDADLVLSSVDPRRTFLAFLDSRELPADFIDQIKAYRFHGSSGKVNLALDALPQFTALPHGTAHLRGAVSISPSMTYMERAYDEAKYGDYSKRPYIDMVIPTLTDPSMAPPGKHVLSCFVQYAPYALGGGAWDDAREAFGDAVIETLAEYAPNIRRIVLHRQVLTPLDLERDFGLTEGNIFHGELALDQLFFMRPIPGWAQYKTPIRNLWMCGSSTHPGGGVMGAPGRNAAREILGIRGPLFG
jgi:phytoene dehydrogenase-like protein